MKIAALISRMLLGLMFLVFGLNGFFPFLPNPPLPPGHAGQFLLALFGSHYVLVVAAFQLVAGLLLLAGLYIPLALAILAPILVNIWSYHVLMFPHVYQLAILATVLWIFLFYYYRRHFAGLFVQRA